MEIWKDIQGYEGIYQVSNLGNIRSLNRTVVYKNGKRVRYKGKHLIPAPNSRGYLRVELKGNGEKATWFVHRLVATHFVENPTPSVTKIVNHLDSNILNNKSDNLEWTTPSGNIQHSLKYGNSKRTKEWLDHLHESQKKYYKPVAGFDPVSGEIKIIFESLNGCREHGYQPSCVCVCCKNPGRKHKGLSWKYF